MKEKHTIILTVMNRVGILARISGLLAQRGFNIESVIGALTEDPDVYKITLVLYESERAIEQVTKHDVIAFTTCVAEHVGEDARYIHWGLTSSDKSDRYFT